MKSLVWLLLLPLARSQLTCTLSATDEDACLKTKDDDGTHCAWCSLSSFGFCLSESAAAAMEQTIPNVQCDRYSGSDDDEKADDDNAATDDKTPSTDDQAPKNDDVAPKNDDVSPNDDTIPPNFWKCLENKDPRTCESEGCTWCDSKAGWGLCMTGPSAESAEKSDFFKCHKEVGVENPYDISCVQAFVTDQTEEACTSAVDQDGQPCMWCNMAGMANLCLTHEQADMGSSLGITCEKEKDILNDPYDPSCILAFLQDQTEEGCTSATDQDGRNCEWCSLQGSLNLCLNEDQAEMGEQLGITCDTPSKEENTEIDLYDTSCIMATFSGSDQESCTSTLDEDGNSCQWCSVQGMANVCLTGPQADTVEQFGVTCNTEDGVISVNPMDPSCFLAFLGDQSKDACLAAVDQEGNPCEFCHLTGFGSIDLCLTPLQAQGIACENTAGDTVSKDLYDKSCIVAHLNGDGSKESCEKTVDEDGNNCKWCHNPIGDICLTDMQGDMVSQLGFWCDDSVKAEKVDLPDDFWSCLQNYEQKGCSQHDCTWCDTSVGMGFCMAPKAADALKECTFFDCQFESTNTNMGTPYDPVCLAAGMGSDDAAEICDKTMDSDGNPCVWCDAAGVFGLCLSSEQAAMAAPYLQCDSVVATE